MKPRIFTILIIITFISLIGVVFTQVYWVNNAIKMKEEHFSQSVRIAMKSVLNHLIESNTDSTLKRMCMPVQFPQEFARQLSNYLLDGIKEEASPKRLLVQPFKNHQLNLF